MLVLINTTINIDSTFGMGTAFSIISFTDYIPYALLSNCEL